MQGKSKIDKIRDSGGTADVGTDEEGAIAEMLNINNERLLIIKERAIYEIQTADDIDPDRTNISLPNTIQKLFIDQGTESELVCRTLLTAKRLFKKGYLNDEVNIKRLLELSLELVQELTVLQSEINSYIKKEQEVNAQYYSQKGSYKAPSISDAVTRCKTIFQKADHIEQIIMETVTVFYPNEKLTKQSHFPKLHDVLDKLYGKEDRFTYFVNETLHFMQVIRQLRNGLDHRLDFVTVFDYQIKPDGSIISPSIELNHKEAKLKRESLTSFLSVVLKDSITIYENMIAYLTDKHLKSNPLNFRVNVIPEEKRRNKHIQFSLWSPIGKEGFFEQS